MIAERKFVTSTCVEGGAVLRHKRRPQEIHLAELERSSTVKTATKIIIASMFSLSIAAPAFAQSSGYGYRSGGNQQTDQHQATASGGAEHAFAMEPRVGSQIDPNSPAAAGGGNLSCNQRLLLGD